MTPCTAAHQASLSFIVSWSWLKLLSIESVIPSNHLVFFFFFFLTISSSIISVFSCLQSFPASGSFLVSQMFASGGWPKYWSFNFSISPFNEYPGLISFRIDKFYLLSVQSLWLNFIFPLRVSEPVMELGPEEGPSLITSWVSLCSLLN